MTCSTSGTVQQYPPLHRVFHKSVLRRIHPDLNPAGETGDRFIRPNNPNINGRKRKLEIKEVELRR